MATHTSEPVPDPLHALAVERCKAEARQDSVFAGLSAGLAGAIIGSKFFRFNRNTTILCGAVTGILSGYQFYRAFLSSHLARLEAERTKLSSPQAVIQEDKEH